jgi:hypothetical protein
MTATVIDPNGTWRKVEERLRMETDPRLRRNLDVVLEHMKAEAVGDLDRLMATVSEAAHWHAYGSPPDSSPEGKSTVRQYYQGVIPTDEPKRYLALRTARKSALSASRVSRAWREFRLGSLACNECSHRAAYASE